MELERGWYKVNFLMYINDTPHRTDQHTPWNTVGWRTLRELKAQPLRAEHISQAYPLIQAALPGVPLESWVAFARALIDKRDRTETGIISIVSEQGYVAGLSCYRIDQSLVHGQSLTADLFVALDMFDRRAVVIALAAAVEALARARQCGAVHTTLLEKGGVTASALTGRGHEVAAVRLCKILPHAEAVMK